MIQKSFPYNRPDITNTFPSFAPQEGEKKIRFGSEVTFPYVYYPEGKDSLMSLMKKGGAVIRPERSSNINININLPNLYSKKLKSLRKKSYKKKGFESEKEPLRKPDFVKLLSRSQYEEPKAIYTGNNIRLQTNPIIYGAQPPRALSVSTYAIPTTISNPIRGTFQQEFKPETEEEKEKKRIDLEKNKLLLEQEKEKLLKLKRERLALEIKQGNESKEESLALPEEEESLEEEQEQLKLEYKPDDDRFSIALFKWLFNRFSLSSILGSQSSVFNSKNNYRRIIVDVLNTTNPLIWSKTKNYMSEGTGKTGIKNWKEDRDAPMLEQIFKNLV